MISDCQFPIDDLATKHTPAVNSRGVSVSPGSSNPMLAEMPFLPTAAGGGNVRTSHSSRRASDIGGRKPETRKEETMVETAKRIVVKEIMEILRNDMPDARAHSRYLKRLKFTALCARRDQLKIENQREFNFTAENAGSAKI